MIELKSTKDAKFVDMVPYLFRHKRTQEEMKFADIIYDDVVGYFIEEKGVLYFTHKDLSRWLREKPRK